MQFLDLDHKPGNVGSLWKLKKARNRFSTRKNPQKGVQPNPCLEFSLRKHTWDFWSLWLLDNKFVLFYGTKFVVICCTRKQTHFPLQPRLGPGQTSLIPQSFPLGPDVALWSFSTQRPRQFLPISQWDATPLPSCGVCIKNLHLSVTPLSLPHVWILITQVFLFFFWGRNIFIF